MIFVQVVLPYLTVQHIGRQAVTAPLRLHTSRCLCDFFFFNVSPHSASLFLPLCRSLWWIFHFHLGFCLEALPNTLHPLPQSQSPSPPSPPLSLYCHPFFFSSLLHLISIQRKEFTCKFFHRQSFNTMSYITVRQPWLPVHVIKCQMYVIKIDIMCTCAPALLSTRCNVICLHIMW